MAYRMTEIAENIYVGKMSGGDLDLEIWSIPKPPHATTSDYEAACQQVIIPAHAVDALFDFLR